MSIRDLAKHLGLSVSTVSRALNGYQDVSQQTRLRVEAAAREVGYFPNPAARRLVTGRANAVGIVLPLPRGKFIDPYFAGVLSGANEVLLSRNYHLLATAIPINADERELYERFIKGGWVDGLIVGRTRVNDAQIDYLMDQGIPFVAFGRTQSRNDFAWLDADNEGAFERMATELLKLGHRRIGLLNASLEYNFADLRKKGVEKAMRAYGLELDPRWMREVDISEQSGRELTRDLMTQPERPTAILCINDSTAIGALAACRELGLVVGRDVSVVGFDNSEQSTFTDPPLSTIDVPVYEIGQKLADMLLRRMEGEAPENLQILEIPEWVPRESHGPAPD